MSFFFITTSLETSVKSVFDMKLCGIHCCFPYQNKSFATICSKILIYVNEMRRQNAIFSLWFKHKACNMNFKKLITLLKKWLK